MNPLVMADVSHFMLILDVNKEWSLHYISKFTQTTTKVLDNAYAPPPHFEMHFLCEGMLKQWQHVKLIKLY